MDTWLLLSQNQWAGSGYWTDYLAYALAEWGPAFHLLLVVSRWLVPGTHPVRSRHAVILSVTAALLAVGCNQLLTLIIQRPRPYAVLDVTFNLLGGFPSASFPSDHASAAFAIAWTQCWRSRFWGWLFWPLSLAIGWARVYAGVHYPSDILGSFVLAFFVGWGLMELEPDLEPALDRILAVLPGWMRIRIR